MHADVFRVHLVPGYFFAFHRFERARPDVERHFLAVDAVGIQIGQHAFGEMESGRGGSHAAFDFRVHRLVGRLVAFLCLAVQVVRPRLPKFQPKSFVRRPIQSQSSGWCRDSRPGLPSG